MSTEEDNMVQEPYNGEEEGMEQFFSPNSQRAPDPVSQDTAAQASQVQPPPASKALPWTRQKKRCEVCGSYYLKLNKARHERSKKHKDESYLWFDCFEVKKFI